MPMRSSADYRFSGQKAVKRCLDCGAPMSHPLVHRARTWCVMFCMLTIGLWTGIAAGIGLYAQQVGADRARNTVDVALAALHSGKTFDLHLPSPMRVARRR
jgi:hypothetical protein